MQRRWTMIVGGLAALGVLLVALVLAIPVLFGSRIEQAVREQAGEGVLADVSIGDIQLSLFAQFPLLEVRVDDVAVVGQAPYAGVPLLTFDSLALGVDLWSVVGGGPIEVHRVDWLEPAIDVRIEEDGTSNLDIFPPSDEPVGEDDTATDFAVVLESLTISRLDLDYADASLGLVTQLRGLGTQLAGRFDPQVASISATTTADAWSLSEGGVGLVRDAAVEANLDLDYALETGAITLRDNALRLNELGVSFSGSVTPQGDDLDLDLTFASEQTSFKSLLSLVPAAYIEGYEDVKADGTFRLAGSARGLLPAEGDDLPGFSLDIEVEDGQVQYPELPSSVDGIGLAMTVEHPPGPADTTVVDIPRFAFAVAGAPMAGSLRLENPTTDPLVALTAKGTLDFVKLAAAMPGEGLPTEGVVELDVDLAGRSSDFEAQAIDAVKAEGTIAARNLMITDTGYPTPIRVQRMQMAFDPAVVDIPDLALSWLGSDLEIRAKLDNFVPYALGKAALDGEAQLTSKVLDLRPFQGETTEETADEPAAGGVVVVVPDDLALTLQARFTEVVTQELSLRDMVGQLSVADQAVVIDELKASMLGGRVSITGRYAARTPEAADIDFRIEALRFDLPQTVREFATLARIAPVLKGVTGSFDSDFQLTSRLDREGNPDLAGLTSSGSLLASGLRLTPVTLNGAAEKLKRPSLSALEVGKRRIDFVIEQGKLRFVEPFEAKLGGYAAQVSGGAGIVDRTLDLAVDLDLPVNAIAGSSFLEGLGRLTGDTVGLQLGITGGYDAPKLAIRRADADAPKSPIPLPDPRERLVAEATEKGDALVAAAEDRAAKIRAQAKTRADDLRREGRQQAKRIEREAGSNPIKKAAAKTAADAARRTAYKAADKAENEADKQADKIVAEARKQRAKLIAEASGG